MSPYSAFKSVIFKVEYMNNNFHFQAACNSIIHLIEAEMNAENSIRLSLDVQLPHQVVGDEQGMGYSIVSISKFLNQQLCEGMIDIEVTRLSQDNEILRVRIDIRGTDQRYRRSKQDSVSENMNKLEWIKKMPYKTSYVRYSHYHLFSFEMSFQHNEMNPKQTALIFSDKRILLAEDNEMSASVFSSFLEEWGCKVTRVSNGKDALTAFEENVFEMILVDSYMPDLNGNQVIKKIRAVNSNVPIIVLTSSSLEKDVLKSMAVGANDFLLKPVSSMQLKAVLKKYLV